MNVRVTRGLVLTALSTALFAVSSAVGQMPTVGPMPNLLPNNPAQPPVAPNPPPAVQPHVPVQPQGTGNAIQQYNAWQGRLKAAAEQRVAEINAEIRRLWSQRQYHVQCYQYTGLHGKEINALNRAMAQLIDGRHNVVDEYSSLVQARLGQIQTSDPHVRARIDAARSSVATALWNDAMLGDKEKKQLKDFPVWRPDPLAGGHW